MNHVNAMKQQAGFCIISLTLLLAACAKDPPPLKPSDLRGPDPALMQKPAELPDYKEGDAYKDEAARLRAKVGDLTTQVDGLQGYVKTIRKQK